MTIELALVLALLAAAIVMFVMDRPRMDAVGLIMIIALPFTGAVSIAETIQGFADNSVVVLAALFVVGASLVRTGVARRIGDWIAATAAGDEVRVLVLMMLAVAVALAFAPVRPPAAPDR